MELQNRIIANVRDQAIVSAQIRAAMEQANTYQQKLERLSGQMELMQDLFVEQNGKDLNQYMNENDAFRKALVDARESGARIAVGAQPEPTGPVEPIEPPAPTAGTVKHTGNKKLKLVDDKKEPQEPVAISRKRQPPKIVVDDEPPKPGADEG